MGILKKLVLGVVVVAPIAAAGSAVIAAGSAVAAAASSVVGGTVARAAAKKTGEVMLSEVGKKVLAGVGVAATGKVAYEFGKSSGYEEGHREGHEAGFENGYKKGVIDVKRKMGETIEHHIARVVGIFAIGLYISDLDGSFDAKDEDTINTVLGNPNLHEEYVKKELQKIFSEHPNFYKIKISYLDKLNEDDLNEFNDIISNLIWDDGIETEEESNFYNNEWLPYCNSRRRI